MWGWLRLALARSLSGGRLGGLCRWDPQQRRRCHHCKFGNRGLGTTWKGGNLANPSSFRVCQIVQVPFLAPGPSSSTFLSFLSMSHSCSGEV